MTPLHSVEAMHRQATAVSPNGEFTYAADSAMIERARGSKCGGSPARRGEGHHRLRRLERTRLFFPGVSLHPRCHWSPIRRGALV